jgi:uncharacterized protein involved in exopolysaccharide biosynthesis
VELHGAPFELTRGEGAQAPGDGAQAGAGGQVWALYPLLSPAESRPASPPDVDLLRLLPEVARRGRRWLAIGAGVGLAFGAAYLSVADRVFIVKSVLQVELRKSVIHDLDARPGSTYVGTQAEVIQSPAMIGEAIREIGLPVPEPSLLGRVRAWIAALNPFPAEEVVDPIQRAVLATLPALQASPVLGTDVLALTLRTDAPQRGVRLLDALITSYQRYVRDNETAAHREGLGLLRQREAGLAAQIAELADSHREQESTIRSLGRGADALSVQRMGLEEQARARVEAQRRRIDLENELAALREQRDAQVAPSREIQDELVRAEAALSELRARLSALHPDVVQLEQRVAGLREQVRVGGRMRVAELERQVRAARRTEGALAGLYDREWEGVKALEVERAQLEKLGAEIARLEQQRAAVVALLGEKELSLLAAQAGENSGTVVRVLQAPSIPPDPVWPLPLPVLVACSFVGVLGGLGFALLAHWRESRGPQPEPDRFGDPASFDAPIPRIAQRPLR